MTTHSMHLKYRTAKRYPTIISIVPPGVALIVLTFRGSNYHCHEQIGMVPKGFEPSRFDCIVLGNSFLQCAKTKFLGRMRTPRIVKSVYVRNKVRDSIFRICCALVRSCTFRLFGECLCAVTIISSVSRRITLQLRRRDRDAKCFNKKGLVSSPDLKFSCHTVAKCLVYVW